MSTLPSQHDDSEQGDALQPPGSVSAKDVIASIEGVAACVMESLQDSSLPQIEGKGFGLNQCRSFTSIMMVLQFCHALLNDHRTTTTREVFYFFVTHFRSQKECDAAIWDAASLLQVPRSALGLTASPKGWFCGSLEIFRDGFLTDCEGLSSMQGLPITREWLEGDSLNVRSKATCILVVEKEGVYNRLSEDRFFERIPSILVTGKGFPDLATRALVKTLHGKLQLPVFGICDCNPFGIGVLHTYQVGSKRIGIDGGDRYGVPIQWMGLRPSHVEELRQRKELPKDVFQALTDIDKKRLDSLCDESHAFHSGNNAKLDELILMRQCGYKIELEALHWMGMDYMSDWLESVLKSHHKGNTEAIL